MIQKIRTLFRRGQVSREGTDFCLPIPLPKRFFFSDKKGLVLHRSIVIGWDNRSENPSPIPVGGASHIGVSLDKLQ